MTHAIRRVFFSLAPVLPLIVTCLSQIASAADHRQSLLSILTGYTLGNDGFYNRVISAAKVPNMQLSESDRTQQMNLKISTDLAVVINAFETAPEEQKQAAVHAAAVKIDAHFSDNETAKIQFIDGHPSAALGRVVLMIEKKNLTADRVLDLFTSYKRSAKPKDYVYEYQVFDNLTQGQIRASEGNDKTWFPPLAAKAIKNDENIAIKKCRSILGWRCGTSIYRVSEYKNSAEDIRYFYIGNYDLSRNRDNAEFSDDGRSKNQVSGSTALYVVRESGKWILLTGMDVSWSTGSMMFQSVIESEFQKDADRFLQRLNSELK